MSGSGGPNPVSPINGVWRRAGVAIPPIPSVFGSVNTGEPNLWGPEGGLSLLSSKYTTGYKCIFTGGDTGLFYAESPDGITQWTVDTTQIIASHKSSSVLVTGASFTGSIAAGSASFTGGISGTTLTTTTNNAATVGGILTGAGVTSGTRVVAQLTATTYQVSISQTVSSGTSLSETWGVLTVSAITSGQLFPGTYITVGASGGTQVTAIVSGAGGVGSVIVNNTQTVSSTAMTAYGVIVYAAVTAWTQIDIYTASTSGGTYNLFLAAAITNTGIGAWSASTVTNTSVFLGPLGATNCTPGTLYMFLEGYAGGGVQGAVGLLTSTDGQTFAQPETNPVMVGPYGGEIGGPATPFYAIGLWWMYVHSTSNNGPLPNDIFLASAPSLTSASWTVSAHPALNRSTSDEGVNSPTGQLADPSTLQVTIGNQTKALILFSANFNGSSGSELSVIKAAWADMPMAQLVQTAQGDDSGSLAIGYNTGWVYTSNLMTFNGGSVAINYGSLNVTYGNITITGSGAGVLTANNLKVVSTVTRANGSFFQMDYSSGTRTFTQGPNTSTLGTWSVTQCHSDQSGSVQSLLLDTSGALNLAGNLVVTGTITSASILRATSSAIGGSALILGQTASTTVTVAGAATTMVAQASPASTPGAGFIWNAYVSAANTVTVTVTCIVAGTPNSVAYNVAVFV
jgi:hypothetical protein